MWAEMKHKHQLFKLGSFKSSLRCLAGLGPAARVPAAGGTNVQPEAHLGLLQNRTPQLGPSLPFLHIQKPFLPAKRVLAAGGDGLVNLNISHHQQLHSEKHQITATLRGAAITHSPEKPVRRQGLACHGILSFVSRGF